MNRSLKIATFLVAPCLLLGSFDVRPSFSDEISDEWVDRLGEELVAEKTTVGLSIGYIQGKRYGTRHFGKTRAGGDTPTNLTVYELGSISKVFTSLLVAGAEVRGTLDLDAPIRVKNSAGMVLPDLEGRPIRWVDLCTHRSGLPRLPSNLAPTSMRDPYRDYDAKKAASFLSSFELPRTPGAAQEYSNFGASVLGYLIAENEKATYQKLLRERIALPLRMSDCTVDIHASQKTRTTTPHSVPGKPTPMWKFADMPGAGGIKATLRDMMRFAKANLDPPEGELGKTIELAWQQHTPADKSGPAMGLGWHILPDGTTHWHNGGTGGSSSMMVINRELRTAIIVLANTSVQNKLEPLAFDLLRGGSSTPRGRGKSADMEDDPADETEINRKRLVGRYQLAPTFVFNVQDVDGRMMVGITNQPTQEVFADSPTRWSYRSVEATLEFHLRSKGPAYALTLHQNGAKQRARRMKD